STGASAVTRQPRRRAPSSPTVLSPASWATRTVAIARSTHAATCDQLAATCNPFAALGVSPLPIAGASTAPTARSAPTPPHGAHHERSRRPAAAAAITTTVTSAAPTAVTSTRDWSLPPSAVGPATKTSHALAARIAPTHWRAVRHAPDSHRAASE